MCNILRYWAGLQAGVMRSVVEEGADRIQGAAARGQEEVAHGPGARIVDVVIEDDSEQ